MADASSDEAVPRRHEERSVAESGPPPEQSNVQPRQGRACAAFLWGLTAATTMLLLVAVFVTAFVTTTLLVPNGIASSGQPAPPPASYSDAAALLPKAERIPPGEPLKGLVGGAGATRRTSNLCDSTACVEQARLLLRQINSSRDPCNDFYAYVCEDWARTRPLAPGADRVSMDTILVEGYAELLASALEHDRAKRDFPQLRFLIDRCLEPEKGLFERLLAMFLDATHLRHWMTRASTPAPRRRPSAAEVSHKFGIAFRQLGVDALFRPFVVKHVSNETKRYVGLGEPSVILLRAPLEKEQYELVRAGFAHLLGFFQNSTGADLLRFEERLRRLLARPPLDEAVLANASTVKVRDLPAMRNFECSSFLQSVFSKGLRPITERTFVKLSSPEYVLRLVRDGELLRSSHELLGYLLFRMSMALSPLLGSSKELAAVSCARHPEFAQAQPQSHYCLCLLDRFEPNLLLHATHNLSRMQLSGGGAVVEDMVSTMRLVAVEYVVARLARLGSELKAHLQERLNGVSWEPLAPLSLENASARAAYMDGVYLSNPRTSTAQFFYTWIRKSLEKRLMAHMSSRVPYLGWTGGFLSAEGRLEPPYVRLEIPLPVFDLYLNDDPALRPLQMARAAPRVYRPLFRAVYHWVYNFEFDAPMEWRGRGLAKSLQDLRLCLERQYASLPWPGMHERLDATSTSWSDLWDMLSLRPALEAFLLYAGRVSPDYRLPLLERWNASQLFFLYYAVNYCENGNERFLRQSAAHGPHSPAWYRVNGPLRNTPEFARAFGCRPGSFMNPAQQCALHI